jgi:hypothetical protein
VIACGADASRLARLNLSVRQLPQTNPRYFESDNMKENDNKTKTTKNTLAIVGFALGVLTVIIIVFIVERC